MRIRRTTSATSLRRAVKTDAEQAVIDEAYRIARLGLEGAVDAIRPGTTEREVAAAAEGAMRARHQVRVLRLTSFSTSAVDRAGR